MSDPGQLFAKMEADKMASYIHMGDDQESGLKLLSMITPLLNGTRSVSLTREMALFGTSGMCMLDANAAGLFRMSEHTFAHGILTTFMNRQAHPLVKKLIRYRIMSVFEMGTFVGFFNSWKLQILDIEFDRRPSMAALECQQSVLAKKLSKVFEYEPMAIESLQQLWVVAVASCLFLCVAILIEVLISKTERKRKMLAQAGCRVKCRLVRTFKLSKKPTLNDVDE
ncbi:hypothetical protein HDE_10009 [Halotydeus destructor]|nr:hypothetical protein HDE_10009 [Halotydeus destructor]